MGIKSFFHKIKMFFVRSTETSIPYTPDVKRYGNYGEDEFICHILNDLPFCKIKRNVIINTPDGNAEIDCLMLYKNKLFAIEVKNWKGRLFEQANGDFIQEKTDRYTGEIHVKHLKSPFKQLGRAIHLLKEQIPDRAWIEPIVLFADDELETISVRSEQTWFDNYYKLLSYIQGYKKDSRQNNANSFFEKCIPADRLCKNNGCRSLYCRITDESLFFLYPQGILSRNEILSIRISHQFSYDELFIKLLNKSEICIKAENAKIVVDDNGVKYQYALCNLTYIELGRSLFR